MINNCPIERWVLRFGVRVERLGLRLKFWAGRRIRRDYERREQMARPTDEKGRPV